MQSAQLEQRLESLVSPPQISWPNTVNPQTGGYTQIPLGYGQALPYTQAQMFAEGSQNEFAAMSPLGLKVESGNLLIMVLGAILAGSIGGIINRFFPVGAFAPVIGGVILRMILKSGKGRDFANGVLIGGAASALSGVVGNLTGGLFAERKTSAPSRISQPTNLGNVKF